VARWNLTVRKDYDLSKGKCGAVIASPGEARITIMLDADIIEHCRERAEAEGFKYQTKINAVMCAATTSPKRRKAVERPITEAALRKILREELREAG
jgi:peptidyl-tRNA hydrolase